MRKIISFSNYSNFQVLDKMTDTTIKDPVSACGLLLYRIKDGNLEVLLTKYRDKQWPCLDDFGGRIDIEDRTLEEASLRETYEESNSLIKFENLKNCPKFYCKKLKYVCFLKQVESDFFDDCSVFGEKELINILGRVK